MGKRAAGLVEYEKLSRRSGSLVSYHQLWKGPDHLLMVKEVGAVEEYKRFYFSDVQALIMMRSNSYSLWAILLPVIALSLAGVGTAMDGAKPVFMVFATILMVFWGIHLLRGGTCKCWIQTGINKERLIMFKRIRVVKKCCRR